MTHPLYQTYQQNKKAIKTALILYKKAGQQNEQTLFAELCFCICTPQSKARQCDNAIHHLATTNNLYMGNAQIISTALVNAGVRFHKNKARYIIHARTLLQKELSLTTLLQQEKTALQHRTWLVQHIKGIGYKEASHFLRNIGKWENLTILDRHILKNLVQYNVIRSIPQTLTPKKYLTIEKKMQHFAAKINIPLEALDLVFWSKETGEIFK